MKNLLALTMIFISIQSYAAKESIFCSTKAPNYLQTNSGDSYSVYGMALVVDIIDGKAGNAYWLRNSFGVVHPNGALEPKTASNPSKEQILSVKKKTETNFYETYPAQTVVSSKYEIRLASDGKYAGTVVISIDVNNGRESGKGKWEFKEMTQSETFAFCTKNVK